MTKLLDRRLADYYAAAFPEDSWAIAELDPKATFADALNTLRAGKDIYTTIGASDSIVRELIFGELADLLGVDYDDIYNLWLYKTTSAALRAAI